MATTTLADDLVTLASEATTIDVLISYDVVKLFSEQLYKSPVKAIEELVVNSWDAEARVCSVLVAPPSDRPRIAVFDDGKGMTVAELANLWHIGVSSKPGTTSSRKQIGKFGIGKLASYAVARRATYVSKTAEGIHAVSINFEDLDAMTDENGLASRMTLSIRAIDGVAALSASEAFEAARAALETGATGQDLDALPSWTLVVLEDLKEKAAELSVPRLRWVLETAMPFDSDFGLYLNGAQVLSSKDDYNKIVHFKVHELDEARLKDLAPATGETWTREADRLVSPSFPQGVTGDVYVTDKSLYAEGGKSEDLGRSHGFFVRAHNRLINETDPLFGARPLSFETWYSFAAIVEADDLNKFVTASRDDVEQSAVKARLKELLIQLFNQARDGVAKQKKEAAKKNKENKEGQRDYVSPDLIERPLADALVRGAASSPPPGQDKKSRTWRLIEPVDDLTELQELVEHLYTSERESRSYTFKYSPAGQAAPVARLDARTATFYVNEDHELTREFAENTSSRRLLEALIVAECVLEAHLRGIGIEAEIVSEVLDRRDTLLRSLALDESYSFTALAAALRNAAGDWKDLEVALVGALRALGFTAQHIGGSGTPDGLAEYRIHGLEGRAFTLEAKSSEQVPSLSQLDFAGLHSHFVAAEADGCLLVAPSYPGADDPDSQVSHRSVEQHVSCWTIEQLARVVEAAQKRHINARDLQEIVLGAFTPIDVTAAVEHLLSQPAFDKAGLYAAAIRAIRELEPRLRSTPRDVSMVATEISRFEGFGNVDTPDVREALLDLARSSNGMLHITEEDQVVVLGALEELERRVAHLTGEEGEPRRRGTLRDRGPGE